ncbi:MAG: DMT family transporter [Myxococcota bacterium]
MLLATVLFSVMSVSARLASADASWTLVAAARSGVGVGVAWTVARARRVSLRIDQPRVAWGRSLCGTAAVLCTFFTLGAPAMALGDIASLRGTAPVFIALLGVLILGESPGRRVFLAVPIAFSGVVMVLRPQLALAGHLALIALVGAFMSALAMTFLRRLGPTEQPEAVALHFMVVSFVVTFALSLTDLRIRSWGGAGWLALAGMTGGLAQLAVTRAYALERAARVGAIGYFGIVLTQFLAEIWLGEVVEFHQRLGALMVVMAGLVLAVAAVRDRRQRNLSWRAVSERRPGTRTP